MLIRPLPRRRAVVGDLRGSKRLKPRRAKVALLALPPTPPGPELPVFLLAERYKRARRSRLRA